MRVLLPVGGSFSAPLMTFIDLDVKPVGCQVIWTSGVPHSNGTQLVMFKTAFYLIGHHQSLCGDDTLYLYTKRPCGQSRLFKDVRVRLARECSGSLIVSENKWSNGSIFKLMARLSVLTSALLNCVYISNAKLLSSCIGCFYQPKKAARLALCLQPPAKPFGLVQLMIC